MILKVQISELSESAELGRDAASELIISEVPKRHKRKEPGLKINRLSLIKNVYVRL